MRDRYDDNFIERREQPIIRGPEEDFWDDDFWDDDPDGYGQNISGRQRFDMPSPADWEDVTAQLPPRETTRRRVRSSEQEATLEMDGRAWRQEKRPEPEKRGNLRARAREEEETADIQMPLFLLLVVTGFLLTILGGAGRLHGYRDLTYDFKRAPLLTLVFDGLHEHISPIAALTQDPVQEEAVVGTDPLEENAAAAETETAPEEPEEVDLTIPEGVNDEVVTAVDYGICDARLLAPSGTTYEPVTSGIFAPNGTYLEPQTVDARYLNDALFIGDSRTDGLHLYGGMADDAFFWCKEALSIYDIFDATATFYAPGEDDREGMSLQDVMEAQTFRKIYVSIGINELGTPDTERFYAQYKTLLTYLREQQPDAILYIQGIMHVSASYSQSDVSFNNTNIVEKNTAIASLANGRDIFYLDMNDVVCDENGDLQDALSGDGIHLKASAYALWKEALLEHAFVRDDADWTAPDSQGQTAENADAAAGTGKSESDISPQTGYVVQ